VKRALVYGLAVTGDSVVRALQRRGVDVVVADDTVTSERIRRADELGVELVEHPADDELRAVVQACDIVSPAPGVPESHRVIEIAKREGVEIVTEIELAHRWEQQRPGGPRPMLAITGTDGKTTTTLMAVAMLKAAGLSTVDAGNTSTPFVDAIDDDHDAFVIECASFRLAYTPTFRADAGAWLNLAPDHLNWHRSIATYEAAKNQIWANQTPDDVAIGWAADPRVMARLRQAPGRPVTFGVADADYRLDGETLVGPGGAIVDRSTMNRSLPHDVTNALAASALVLETGLADAGAIERALSTFAGPAHRLEFLGEWGGIGWYNDSKATTPHAAAVAIRALDDIVLIAGGQDKGVDLGEMASDVGRVRAVLAIGQTRDAIAAAFSSVPVVERHDTLDDAVDRAAMLAGPGSTVLLSPGCASLDQFRGFEERGDRFRWLVLRAHRDDDMSSIPREDDAIQRVEETT
jgi:UDP-N-acetylmuramoylalanine--D-glutamate ligase